MNRMMRKLIAIGMALVLLLGMTAGAFAAEVPSGTFRLPKVNARVEATESPAEPAEPTAAPTATPAADAENGDAAMDVPEDEPVAEIGKATVSLKENGSKLNIRAESNADGELLDKIANGETVSILASENGWTKIRTASGVEGWVASSFLSIEKTPVEPTPEPTVEPTAEPTAEPTVEPTSEYLTDENGELILDENGNPIPVETEAPVAEERTLRQVMVLQPECETLALYAEPDAAAAVLAEIPGGTIINVAEIGAGWSFAVYNGVEGYVLTDKIALMDDGMITPEDEAVIRTISITSSIQGQTEVEDGTAVTLTAKLTGFENDVYTLQWKCSKDGGASVENIPGANGLQYTVTVTAENAAYLYALCVTVQDAAAE